MTDKNNFKQEFKKRCFNFSIATINLCKTLPKDITLPIISQLIRSSTSIGANIVEGGNSTSKKEFINYFQISLKSASETIYWLELLKEINVNYEKQINFLINECTEIKKIISTIILNTKSKQYT
jgi:four helix bundle protein